VSTALVFVGLAVLVGAVAWRPHGLGPTVGAALAVALAALGGAVELSDVRTAAAAQWRAYITLAAVMTMTSAAERLGLLTRLAAIIEPRTRGPVKHAFQVTFALSALVAAALSNDAAILLMTPTVLLLLRTVYPRRHPKFLVPFAVAVFTAAGVAPLVISNPMNLIFCDHAGIGFNAYAVAMIPVAIAGWLVAYAALAWIFRDVLADPAPALGAWPTAPERLSRGAQIVLMTVAVALCAYPVFAYFDLPLWPVAAAGAAVCVAVSVHAGHRGADLAGGVAWTIFPFLMGVFILAMALERVGVVAWLRSLYGSSPAPVATIGVTSAIGSALLNNHPMSVLNAFALDGSPDAGNTRALAALVGGDLGPRLLPVGSLASLLWYDLLRKHQVDVHVTTFIRVGVLLTVPTLAVSLLVLWLVTGL
jgi:arsenical pump membrane protein